MKIVNNLLNNSAQLKHPVKTYQRLLFIIIGLLNFQLLQANESSVYAGVYMADVKAVEATNKIKIEIPVWSGYQRQLTIKLPHLDVPIAYEKAPACHLKLIKDGMIFTKNQIKNAEKIEVKNIKMEDSRTELGTAELYLDNKKLSSKLLQTIYARSDKIAKDKIWCSDEK